MFRLTPRAAEEIRRAAAHAGASPVRLRIAAKMEGNEIVYGMGFDEIREQDAVIDCEGVTILIAPRSQPWLAGATLDFVEIHPGEFQFVFFNPNEPSATPPCATQRNGGCGSCGGGGCGA